MRLPHRLCRHTPRHIPRRTNSASNNSPNINQCFRYPGGKKDGNGGDNIAVLIDSENVKSQYLTALMNEVASHGTASVRRIYGDWTNPAMKTWRESLLMHSIVPIQQFAYAGGKNSTDAAMMIDAMDLLYTGRFSTFVLLTGDSDFTRLASRMREQGISVRGFGNRYKSHRAFITACSRFDYLEDLPESPTLVAPTSQSSSWKQQSSNNSPTSTTPTDFFTQLPLTPGDQNEEQYPALTDHAQNPAMFGLKALDQAIVEGIRKIIIEHHKDSFIDVNSVWQRLLGLSPKFHWTNYGYSRPREFILASGIVELKGDGSTLVRLKDRRREQNPAAPLIPAHNPLMFGLKPHDHAALEGIQAAVLEKSQGDASSFVSLGGVCSSLTELSPFLAPSSYGYPRLRDFVLASGIVEMKMEGKVAFVRLKDGWRDAITTTTEPLTTSEPLPPPVQKNSAISCVKPLEDPTALEAIRKTIMHLNRHNEVDAFIDISLVRQHLTMLSPETGAALDYKSYGYSTLRKFLRASRIVELKGSNSSALVRLKNGHSHITPLKPPTPQPPSPFEEFPPSPTLCNKPIDESALEGIRQAITSNLPNGQDSFAYFNRFANDYLNNLPSALHYHHYGFSQLRDFVLASGIVELKWEDTTALIRLKDRNLFDRTTLAVLRAAIAACPPYKGGSFVKVSDVGKCLLKASPDFTPENYGFSRLRDFVLASGIVEMHKVGSAWLVRQWDEFELGEASKGERERNMREMMKEDEREDEKGTPSALEDEKVHGHVHQTSLALVPLNNEDGCARGTLSESKDDHGYGYRRSLALVRPEDSHGHDLEYRTSLAMKAEPGHETSSAVVTPEDSHGHEDDQQGIGMPLTLYYGSEHEHETLVALKDEHKHKPKLRDVLETSPRSENETEHETSTSSTLNAESEPEPTPEPKPKSTPLASLARSFFFSEHR